MKSGRHLVELFLVWKTSTGNLERRFRRFRETRTPQRAKLLDLSVEDCMIVDHAPSSKILRILQSSFSTSRDAAKNNYISQLLKLHETLYGRQKQRVNRDERRDAGVKKELVSGRLGPETEAAFGRKREAAVAVVAAACQDKRARMLCNAPLGLSRVAQEAAAESAANPAAASASTVARVAKRAVPVKDQNLRGAEAAAKARAKREEKVVQSSTRARQESAGRDAEDLAPARKAGIMLVRFQDVEARLKAQRLRFTVTSDPVDFVAKVARVPASSGKGHVVLAPLDATDYALSSKIAAAVMGGYCATPKDFLNEKGPPLGIMYCEKYKGPSTYHVAVSPALAEKFPTIQQLLLAIAQAPGSCFKFYKSERKLLKFFDKTVKTTKRLHQRTFVLATSSVRSQVLTLTQTKKNQPAQDKTVKEAHRALYIDPQSFAEKFHDSERALCPGCPK